MSLHSKLNNQTYSIQSLLRLNYLIVLITIFFICLLLRLGFLQIFEYKRYATLSLKNQINIIPIPSPRGIIYDRNGVVLAENIPVYVLELIPERIKNLGQTLRALKNLIPSISNDDIANFEAMRKRNRPFTPIPLKLKLNSEEVAIFSSFQYRFPGVHVKARLMRSYPLGEITAHILGYVGRINAQELNNNQINYHVSDFIGKAGIEKYYETALHGQEGHQEVETNASGRVIRILTKNAAISGKKLYLTLDANIQTAAYNAMTGKKGAIVVLDIKNGEIIAMVSSPSFDPNQFVRGLSNNEYQILTKAKDNPLYNRAVKGLYPPGSTVKPFIAMAGLEKGAINPNFQLYDPGWYKLQNSKHIYHDWKKNGHGMINLSRALAVSCDTYFYQLGFKLGIAAIEDILTQFGFGQLTHIDLLEETAGIVPTPTWKLNSRGLTWYPGDTIITAIGQGYLAATPLQLANAIAILGNKGIHFRPHLLKQSINNERGKPDFPAPIEEYPLIIRDNNFWNLIFQGLQDVVANREGTGYRFGKNMNYSIAAKTGTAQVFGGKEYEKVRYGKIPYENIPENLRDHSLFIAFAPIENPQIAVSVVVENDFTASNIARKVFDSYFEPEKTH